MKKLLIAVSLLIGIVAYGNAESVATGLNATHVGSSSSVFTGSGELYEIKLSTGSGDFVVAFDSAAVGSVALSAFAATQRISPALSFSTTGHTSLNSTVANKIRVKNGLYLFSSTTASGEANRAIVYFKK